jgi:MFS transporter, ACS family, solute carrier family 17 (sodium-dependent inorganic phosphate cotransporter), other
MMAWLPTYFTDTLSLNLTQAAQMSLLPPVVSIIASSIAGPSADYLISAGWDVMVVRRLAQAVAFLGPAACLTAASTVAAGDNALTVGTGQTTPSFVRQHVVSGSN